jgi:hypothetical protein
MPGGSILMPNGDKEKRAKKEGRGLKTFYEVRRWSPRTVSLHRRLAPLAAALPRLLATQV